MAEDGGNRIDNFDIADGSMKLFATVTTPIGLAFDNPSVYIANHTSELFVADKGDTPSSLGVMPAEV